LAFVLLALFCVAPAAWAQEVDEKQRMQQKPPPKSVLSTDNGIYEIFIEDAGGETGQYTAATAQDFPDVGAGENVLYGGGSGFPGTSFNTVRSYTSETDYVFTDDGPSSSFDVVEAASYGTVTSIADGFRTTYTLPGGSETSDALTIEQDLEVLGSTIDDSRVSVTTTVTNDGDAPVTIGIRYLWDFQISGDDGPTYQNISPNGSVLTTEESFSNPDFQSYKAEDNDLSDSPQFSVFGTVNGPSSITPTPTSPDLVQNTAWFDAVDTAFDYETTANQSTDGDQASLIYWGDEEANAVTLDPGESYTVSSSVLGNVPSGEEDTTPPVCELTNQFRNGDGQGVAELEFTDNEENSSGLSDISTSSQTNIASADVESFVPGAEGPIDGTVTQDDPTQSASHTFTVTDVAGNETTCTQTFEAVGGECDVPTLAENDIDQDNRTLSNTMQDDEGVAEFTFTTLDNFTVQSIDPSSGFDRSGDTWTWDAAGDPPTSVDFTLEAGPDNTSTYFLEVTDACDDPGPNTVTFDPAYEFGPAASEAQLAGNAPNPFSGQTTIEFALPEQSRVTVAVYDMMGRKVATLVDGVRSSGPHAVGWNGQSDSGQNLASGVYLLRMRAEGKSETKRMTIIR
jgi:hypothetical protein